MMSQLTTGPVRAGQRCGVQVLALVALAVVCISMSSVCRLRGFDEEAPRRPRAEASCDERSPDAGASAARGAPSCL